MPKMKTKKAAAKRFSLTGTGILSEDSAPKVRKQLLPYG